MGSALLLPTIEAPKRTAAHLDAGPIFAHNPAMSTGLTPAQFIAKWSPVDLPERAASHEHFIDLCRLLGQPTPAEADATGEEYTFERGVSVTGVASAGSKGERGIADVWWRGKFGWEYKRKGKYRTLAEAYRQLCQYREALENPPLLIVSDIARTEIHTNFTGTRPDVHEVLLSELAQPEKLDLLRRVFTDPQSFKPGLTSWKITESVAADFGRLADALRQRKHNPHDAAHFLMKCMFCLFAERVKLLPERVFSKLLERSKAEPDKLTGRLTKLFSTMKDGGDFGTEQIAWFNGGLFDDAPALPLTSGDIHAILIAAEHDWSAVEPSIFGTLFERSLDPDKRAQIGAHYTSRDDIMLIVEPVVIAPLRREWGEVKAKVEKLLAKRRAAADRAARTRTDKAIVKAIEDFDHRLATIRILDPACGSGNFLYVAIQQLLSLEKEVVVYAGAKEIGLLLAPRVRPTQLHGIEINPYAAELAQVVIWIGYLQWMRENGFIVPRNPILARLQTIENRDAILDLNIPTKPQPATWPEADFIIGNPPFLGVRQFRESGLGDDYVERLFATYDLPSTADLCCYWFEQARRGLAQAPDTRVGLLATQGIRGRDSRAALERIVRDGKIFMAWSDRPWILEGAAVHVSMVGFTSDTEESATLDGQSVTAVNADLRSGLDFTRCKALPENGDLSFQGPVKVGKFEIGVDEARKMLAAPKGPTGTHNSAVLRPWRNGESITARYLGDWIVDFGTMEQGEAAFFEQPFEYVRKHVKPERDKNRREGRRKKWWLFGEPNPAMRAVLSPCSRYLATCQTAKYRLWVWFRKDELAAQTVIGVGRSDDYFFGALHSSIHELWALRMGTQLEDRPRYTPTTCFETFPLPWAPGKEPTNDPAYQRISDAARELNEQRERWLNPPEWIEDWGRLIDGRDKFEDVPAEARPLLRQSAIMAEAARDPRFKKRTLTNLYNERPTWLKLAHEKLDRAVLAAYAAVDPEGGWSEDWADVWKDTGAGQLPPDPDPKAPQPDRQAAAELLARRKEIDQRVLANLLRMNLARAGAAAESTAGAEDA